MLANPRRKPAPPVEPRYRRAAQIVSDKVGTHLLKPIEFIPRELKLEVDPQGIVAVAQLLRDDPEIHCELLTNVSGVDMRDHVQVVYQLHSLVNGLTVQLRVRLDREKPVVPSLMPVYPSANWLERETYDMMGVQFSGHPDLRRIMLDDDFDGHPQRKDFVPPAYRGRES